MTWEQLFERAAPHDVTVAEIRETLARVRDGE